MMGHLELFNIALSPVFHCWLRVWFIFCTVDRWNAHICVWILSDQELCIERLGMVAKTYKCT